MLSAEIQKPLQQPVIALLTDFGITDGYVAAMKGVLLTLCPMAHIIDISHHIEPQNVRQAAYVLLSVYRYLPPETIVVAVVDPGVGSSRKPIAVQTSQGTLIGPDNGLFSYVLRKIKYENVYALENPMYHVSGPSTTFHGRDIFSPVAAHVANGVPLHKFGPNLTKLEWLPDPKLHITSETVQGEVIHVDHFGNAITSIGHLTWDADDMVKLYPIFKVSFDEGITEIPQFGVEAVEIAIKDTVIEFLSLTYASVPKGQLISLINSAGMLEIAVNQGHAAQQLGIAAGDMVTLNFG
jgi:hypothetical protein